LIKDLQTRVQEYELKGIAATQDMQRAARKVVQENERLRTLLAQHGVLQEEINAYLRSFEQPATPSETEVAVVRVGSVNSSSEYLPGPQTPNRMYYDSGSAGSVQAHAVKQTFQTSHNRPVQPLRSQPGIQKMNSAIEVVTTSCSNADARANPNLYTNTNTYPNANPNTYNNTNSCAITSTYTGPNVCAPKDACASTNKCAKPLPPPRPTCLPQPQPQTWEPDKLPYTQPATEDAECPNTADCFCPPSTTLAPQENRSGLEISCEAAATIIAQMRGDGDRIAARASLGCRSDEECTIRNSTLMQILDDGR
jgi:hypothetical protein